MSNFTHSCIKCSEQYQDDDVDAYYCSKCNEERKKIAKEVDRKINIRPRKQVKSDLQIYDEMCKARGTAFVSLKDLGIKL